MIKISPSSLGLGMYQHDIKEKLLASWLKDVLEEVVNAVGVDVNTSSEYLLTYISGLSSSRAKAIIDYRLKHGSFQSLDQLRSVKGIGDISFKNAAGFLRLQNSTEPLDCTLVHPEVYDTARKVLKHIGFFKVHPTLSVTHFQSTSRIRNGERVNSTVMKDFIDNCNIDVNEIAAKISNISPSIVSDIITWLKMSNNEDIRKIQGSPPLLLDCVTEDTTEPVKSDTESLSNIQVGQIVRGVVRNITTFGLFLDIGCKHDGLLHNSQFGKLRNFVIGQVLDVQILQIDEIKHRISLGLPSTDANQSTLDVNKKRRSENAPVVENKTNSANQNSKRSRV
jgi:uncharacterized protein